MACLVGATHPAQRTRGSARRGSGAALNALKADPNVVFVKVGKALDTLEKQCLAAGVAFDAFHFKGDYYALPNLIPILSRPSKLDLLIEILETPLPARKG